MHDNLPGPLDCKYFKQYMQSWRYQRQEKGRGAGVLSIAVFVSLLLLYSLNLHALTTNHFLHANGRYGTSKSEQPRTDVSLDKPWYYSPTFKRRPGRTLRSSTGHRLS